MKRRLQQLNLRMQDQERDFVLGRQLPHLLLITSIKPLPQ
jgi:hypothetical protein